MSEQLQTQLVPGPMHPDFFDGETPMLVPAPVRVHVFKVTVGYTVREYRSTDHEVIAATVEEACRRAVSVAESEADLYSAEDGAEDFEAEDVDVIDRIPTPEELAEWWEDQEEAEGMNTYPDEYLEHFADRYLELALRWHGISLEQYLACPAACERVAERNAAAGRVPEPIILPQQISQAQYELERGLESCPRRNGTVIEPLHHHCHPRRSRAADFTRRAKP
ncbi:MAG: hypothetical protein WED00_05835 [Aquisalimonadaceae bacterium]